MSSSLRNFAVVPAHALAAPPEVITRVQTVGWYVILEPTARAATRRNLQLEFIASLQNPSNLLDDTPYSPSSSEEFFSPYLRTSHITTIYHPIPQALPA
ncbi:hypothetical protein B0H14DRAFT_3443342 [Mycena olivaceomarginata]|nr:hypothetical protein B0H14DRAFT_3443342 [Mycena olivaceomarginata]